MRNGRDHEKRVVLEDISSDENMISSLALCEKERRRSYHQILLMTKMKAPALFKDLKMKCKLYQAMKLRTEHGQFAMNILVPLASWIKHIWMMMKLILKPTMMLMKTLWMIQKLSLNRFFLEEDDLDDFDGFNCTSLENPEGLILNTFPRFGELAMKMSRLPLMSPPKLLFKKIIQFYPEIIPQMTGC